ncbi:cell division protein FtsA [candidate division KSB1 bacterium]|nr:MAG: cell division protein FtsA [candidate division KSB1 bacterium]
MNPSKDIFRSDSKRIVTGLDIGTSKIGVVIGEITQDNTVNILGVGTSPSRGLRQGVVINLDLAVESITKAIHEARLTAGVDVKEVVVGIAGDHIRSVNSRGVVGVSRSGQEITQHDVDKVIDAAKAIALPIDREVLHILPQEFIVDNQGGIKNPIGISGVRLEAEIHIVTGAVTSAQNIVRSVKKAGLKVAGLVLEPLASSSAVLEQSEKDLGVVLIDMGGGTTDVALFYGGAIRYTAVIGLGGQIVTNDVALGLRTPVDQAEIIKQKYGYATSSVTTKEDSFIVPGIGGREAREVKVKDLTSIIQPRMEEIFGLAAKEIKRSDYGDLLSAGIVLTGGGSLLRGTAQLAEEVFGLPATIGIPQGFGGLTEAASSPIFSTGVGLVFFGAGLGEDEVKKFGTEEEGLFSRIYQWMKKFADDFM